MNLPANTPAPGMSATSGPMSDDPFGADPKTATQTVSAVTPAAPARPLTGSEK